MQKAQKRLMMDDSPENAPLKVPKLDKKPVKTTNMLQQFLEMDSGKVSKKVESVSQDPDAKVTRCVRFEYGAHFIVDRAILSVYQ